MAGFVVSPRRFRGGVLLALFWGLLAACHNQNAGDARVAERDQDSSGPCGVDEAREYLCDDLLPLFSSRPAAEPFENCPSATEIRPGAYRAVGRVAGFDKGFTEYTRARVQPGHSCCYSWCVKVETADPSVAAPSACHDAYGIHENFCLRELETGSSRPAASPYDQCPAAIKPPEGAVFSAPASALLDAKQTDQTRRESKLPECCYGWCSKTPAGTVLKDQPKTK